MKKLEKKVMKDFIKKDEKADKKLMKEVVKKDMKKATNKGCK